MAACGASNGGVRRRSSSHAAAGAWLRRSVGRAAAGCGACAAVAEHHAGAVSRGKVVGRASAACGAALAAGFRPLSSRAWLMAKYRRPQAGRQQRRQAPEQAGQCNEHLLGWASD